MTPEEREALVNAMVDATYAVQAARPGCSPQAEMRAALRVVLAWPGLPLSEALDDEPSGAAPPLAVCIPCLGTGRGPARVIGRQLVPGPECTACDAKGFSAPHPAPPLTCETCSGTGKRDPAPTALDAACPACEAKPGDKCRDPDGRVLRGVHSSRDPSVPPGSVAK